MTTIEIDEDTLRYELDEMLYDYPRNAKILGAKEARRYLVDVTVRKLLGWIGK